MHSWSANIIKTISVLLLALVIGVPLVYWSGSVYPYTIPKTVFFLIVSELVMALYLGLAFMEPAFRPRRTIWFWSVLAFSAMLLITAFTGEDFSRSFWSIQERNLGVFVFLHFAGLAIALSALRKKIDWDKVWRVSLLASAVVAILAFIQLQAPDLLLQENPGSRPGSTFGNPTFMAGYALFHIFLGLYLFLKDQSGKAFLKKYWPLFTSAINVLAVFASQTRGDILGFGVGILALLAFWSFRPPVTSNGWEKTWGNKKLFRAILAILIFLGASFWLTRSASVWQNVPGLARFQSVSLEDGGLQPRLIAINASWQGIKERPILGWGSENFNLVFNKYYDPSSLRTNYQETRFDKPHNFILEYLVSGGALLLLAFLFMSGAFLWQAFRSGDVLWTQAAVAAFIAYFIENLFVFDTIGPLFLFYLFMSATDAKYADRTEQKVALATNSPNHATGQFVLGAFVLAVIALSLGVSLPTLASAYHQRNGFQYFLQNKTPEAIGEFKKGIDGWSMYRDGYAKDYARVAADTFFYKRGAVTKDDALLVIRELEAVSIAHPKDAFYHNMLLDVYGKFSSLDARYLDRAIEHAQAALALSPNRQETYFGWAKALSSKGDNKGGLELTKKALDLDPEVAESNFYYGLMAYVNEMYDEGYRHVRKGIDEGRPWKNSAEPRVVANFFTDDKHFGEAITLYQKSLEMRDDPETRARLARAYFLSGDRESAKKEFGRAMKQKDLSKSSAWSDFAPIISQLGL
ncbi:MAG: O-antigen ligase family protein [Candidatus Liptonbacteria bacterium]|nr:O-antigen ligase family protein [Candidatus Liptonbacteria bacterium]